MLVYFEIDELLGYWN